MWYFVVGVARWWVPTRRSSPALPTGLGRAAYDNVRVGVGEQSGGLVGLDIVGFAERTIDRLSGSVGIALSADSGRARPLMGLGGVLFESLLVLARVVDVGVGGGFDLAVGGLSRHGHAGQSVSPVSSSFSRSSSVSSGCGSGVVGSAVSVMVARTQFTHPRSPANLCSMTRRSLRPAIETVRDALNRMDSIVRAGPMAGAQR